jgi:hypothetical protein
MNVQIWKAETQKIFWTIIALVIVGFLFALMPLVDPVAAAKGAVGYSMPWYSIVFPILLACMYCFYSYSALTLSKSLSGEAAKGFKLIAIAAGLSAVNQFLGMIPTAGAYIALVVGVCIYVMMLMAFKTIKEDAALPALARDGANLLFIACILALVAVVLALIPVAGAIVAFFISLAVFVLEIIGWVRIMKAEPAA